MSATLTSTIETHTFTMLYCDAPQPWQLGFQDAASPSRDGITFLHDYCRFYLVVLAVLVSWTLLSCLLRFNNTQISHKYLSHGTLIEVLWTVTPALILVAIAFPSFRRLFLIDEVVSPSVTIKAEGQQWFWTYERADVIGEDGDPVTFDSYRVPEEDLTEGQFRLLEVDNPVLIPVDTHVRFVVTARDVRHDFAVPSLGIKIDGIPGRLSQVSTIAERQGRFYGQCSELCGVYHGFRPIVVEAVTLEEYRNWLDSL